VTAAAQRLVRSLKVSSPPKNREAEREREKAKLLRQATEPQTPRTQRRAQSLVFLEHEK
jgi:hypothetical protein